MPALLRHPLLQGETRTAERLRAHYEVERELADRLRHAPAGARAALYRDVYEELFRRVPDHPQLTQPLGGSARAEQVRVQMGLLEPYLTPEATFLEVGAGDCALSIAVARRVRSAIAVDVSETITGLNALPENVRLCISDGTSIPVPPGSVMLAYSNQLMEHLHPDDARAQLRNILAALAPGGRYLCVTPHPFLGPHDISYYFDDVATGFHLREYTLAALAELLREAGFRSLRVVVRGAGVPFTTPTAPARLIEGALGACPPALRGALARQVPFRWWLGQGVVATK